MSKKIEEIHKKVMEFYHGQVIEAELNEKDAILLITKMINDLKCDKMEFEQMLLDDME